MAERWRILAVLFAVRMTMALQYQSVAALSPVFQTKFGIGLGDIGLLIGLYMAPGILFAVPGGGVGRRFGDQQVVAVSMVLMALGGAAMASLDGWTAQVWGRVLAGVGGVALNVVMAKMVTDWFAGREIATAMGVYVNSWPIGIALGLVVLPGIASWGGFAAAMWLVATTCLVGLVLLLWRYRDPPAPVGGQVEGGWPRGSALRLVLIAGAIWGLFNAALAMVFGFGPALLTEMGWPLPAASARVSLVLVGVALSTPLGGLLADRWNRDAVLVLGLLGLAVALVVAVGQPDSLALLLLVGLVAGLVPGPIMSLPADAVPPGMRVLGMGIYFTLYYVAIVAGPMLAGVLAEAMGSAAVAFWMGAVCVVAAAGGGVAFRWLRARV